MGLICRVISAVAVVTFLGGQYLPTVIFADEGHGKFPTQVLIIRHAEKPDNKSDPHLTSQGAGRAAALPSLFQAPPTFPTKNAPFPNPDFIFATKKSSSSDRPVQTVKPLAKALNLKLDHQYADKEHRRVAAEILGDARYAGKTVLICWHHGKIPALAGDLLERSPNKDKALKMIPANFNEARFDRVWWIKYDVGGNATFADRPQKLLFGDLPD